MRRRWQRKTERPSHADDWLMTYADMITLLLCFFAVFLAVSIPKKDVPPKVEAPPPVEQPLKPPDIFEGNLPFHGLEQTDEPADDAADATPLQPIAPAPAPVVASAPAPLPPPTPVQTLEKPSTSLPEIVDNLKTQGNAAIEQKGDRITTLQISSAAFFGSGSATLSDAGKSILRSVAINLKSDKFKDYQVTVEGHTDDSPISTPQFPSNWELSTARAAAVARFFLEQGILAQKLRASGYADTFPIVPNRDAAGNPIPENQAQNRRVVIKLEKIDKSE
jgi:chemotaxis protein MotB